MSGEVWQRTVATAVTLEGRGLHTGKHVCMTIFPAEEDTGIVFRVVQGLRETRIPARIEFITRSSRSTALARDGVTLQTVEHFLAACWGWGISNVDVRVEGTELPGGDGSALIFFEALASAGVVVQGKPHRTVSLKRIFTAGDGKSGLFAFPSDAIRVFYLLDGTREGTFLQSAQFGEGDDFSFLARARTFVFEWEVKDILETNLGLGVRDEALILDRRGKSNHPLRDPQEAAFHKILDFLGDLMLLGCRVQGEFVGIRSGHRLNREMVELLRREVGR
jgi:UDP-3-O-[3-hydroxymyristoyl] N-acetylglucosamine deacetylase